MHNRQTIKILNNTVKAGLQALESVKAMEQDAAKHNQCKGILALAYLVLSKVEKDSLFIEGALIEALSNEIIAVVEFNNACKQRSDKHAKDNASVLPDSNSGSGSPVARVKQSKPVRKGTKGGVAKQGAAGSGTSGDAKPGLA